MPDYQEIVDSSSLWGKLYLPVKRKNISKSGLRTVIFGSTTAGDLVLRSLQQFEEKFPEKLNLVGIATDDPTDVRAKISVKKRIWSHYTMEEKQRLMQKLLDRAMQIGVSCYTGAVKTQYFRQVLKDWDPELIIMCCFGQKVDQYIFDYPSYGMYNFHPSELRKKIGIGAEPFADAMKMESAISHMSLHKVTEKIDHGPVVGTSPPINICLSDGKYPSSILTLQEKIPSVCGWMSIELLLDVLELKDKGLKNKVHCVNYSQRIPNVVKNKLMEPVIDDPNADYSLPPHFMINENIENG